MSHGLIDIHQHLVYGVDDGAKTWDDTVAMMMEAEKQGIERIIATSHALPGRAHFDYDGYLDKLDEINQYAEQQGWRIRLLPGAEIYYTSKALKKLDAEAIPTLNGSRFVLVEFIPEVKADELFRAMRELANGGYNPILAHVERYYCLQDKQEVIQDLRRLGVLIQMNAKTVLQSKGLFGGKSYIRKLLKEGIVDFVATDAHNTSSRPVCLKDAYDFLEKYYGEEKADALTWKNQLMTIPNLLADSDM